MLTLAIANSRSRVWQSVMAVAALMCVVVVAGIAWQAPKSNRAAALVLAARIAPADKVVMVDQYFYDLPFYARLKTPVIIASDWVDPELPMRDNWRKEFFDAARFAPTLGREVLRPLNALDDLLCGSGAVWFVVPAKQAQRVAGLAGITRVFAGDDPASAHLPLTVCARHCHSSCATAPLVPSPRWCITCCWCCVSNLQPGRRGWPPDLAQ